MRLPRSTGALSGLLIIVLGVWGALIPFVGPAFDYSFGTNTTWHYTTDRLWLDIVPGALAVVGGLLLLTSHSRARGLLGGYLATLAGAWYVVGPAVSLTWEHGRGPIGPPLGGPTRQMLELIGYFYGLGALIIALAAFASGRFVSRPRTVTEAGRAARAPATATATAPGADGEQRPDVTRPEAAPARRRFGLGRRRGVRTGSPGPMR